MGTRKLVGIGLIIAPFGLFLLLILLQIILRTTAMGGNGSTATSVINIFSLVLGMIAVIGFLPSIITGIILLATGKKTAPSHQDIGQLE